MKKTTAAEHEILMNGMRTTKDAQNEPKVGLFWYNPERNVLVGVQSAFASELPFNSKGNKTLKILHDTSWESVRQNAIAIGSTDEIWDEESYMMVPRGRVFQRAVPGSDAGYYRICVGSWIRDYPRACELIVKAFNLGNSEYDIEHDEHWDVGRGDSEKLISDDFTT